MNIGQYVLKVVGNALFKGDLTVQGTLKADQISSPGFYAAGVVDEDGRFTRKVGKNISVKKLGTGRFKITHNIGHLNYAIVAIPVNVDDWNAFVINDFFAYSFPTARTLSDKNLGVGPRFLLSGVRAGRWDRVR